MRWDAFEIACPQIAALARDRLAADEVVMLGTLRAGGAPRISACESDIADGRLCLGMMWQSRKARDLRRDPRLTVHSVPSDRINPGGDIKLTGIAVEEDDLDVRRIYRETLKARIDWAPDEPHFHLFSLDVREAAYIRFGDDPMTLHWDELRGFEVLENPPEPDGD